MNSMTGDFAFSDHSYSSYLYFPCVKFEGSSSVSQNPWSDWAELFYLVHIITAFCKIYCNVIHNTFFGGMR
jgi:hypothetical protein